VHIFIQSGVRHFSEIQDGGREFGHSGVLIVWYLCCVAHLVQISVIVTEIDALVLQTFI